MKYMSQALDNLNATYEKIILIGDSNVELSEENMSYFLNVYNHKNPVKQKTCFKNPENPPCIDLILTNCQRSFQSTCIFETRLSDFHKMTVTCHFSKQKPKIIFHQNYKKFHYEIFRTELDNELLTHDICNIEYQHFLNITHTKSHHLKSLKQVMETNEPSLFQPHCSQLNHHNQDFSITASKTTFSLIKSQVLSCIPA